MTNPTDIIAAATEVYNQLADDDPEARRFEEFKERYYRTQSRRDIDGAYRELENMSQWLAHNRHRAGLWN